MTVRFLITILNLLPKQITIQEDHDVHKLSLFCLVALAVEDSRKPLLPETYRNWVFLLYFYFQLKSKLEKNNKKEKLYIFFLNMIWNIEMNFNTIFIYNTYTYICITMISNIMQNCLYNIKVKKFSLAFHKRNIWNISMTFGTFGRQAEPLARRMTRWHIYWHFGT